MAAVPSVAFRCKPDGLYQNQTKALVKNAPNPEALKPILNLQSLKESPEP